MEYRKFELISKYKPTGDQPKAIDELYKGLLENKKFQVLLGATGTGKTFTMANVIQKVNKPTLILVHNKTLAGQLYSEFKELFPKNRVEYFVSNFDFYQPEAYVPSTDTYIEKDSSINDEIDRMRLAATYALMERRDVIVVATVSCIYGLGMPDLYKEMRVHIEKGQILDTNKLASQLVSLQYERNDMVLDRGKFRLRGDLIEIYPAYMETDEAYRIELDFDEVVSIRRFHTIDGHIIEELDETTIYPAKHFVVPQEMLRNATDRIREEMIEQVAALQNAGKIILPRII